MLESDWLPLAQAHRERVEPWIAGRLERRPRGEKNAIEDFLFDYYPYSPGRLATWHPGYGVTLEGEKALPYLQFTGYHRTSDGITSDIRWLDSRQDRLNAAIAILAGTMSRQPALGCFGLHEWAMNYHLSQEQVRHAYLPLRVSPEDVAATVDELGVRCTHMDAYRFFTAEAIPLNAYSPTRATQAQMEQPGCLHAAMDLYKYAFWFAPLVPSELIADCFENARRSRELDMRASPYDMSPFGLEPIRVETVDGRREYAQHQQEMISRTAPLRDRLHDTLVALRSAWEVSQSVTAPAAAPDWT